MAEHAEHESSHTPEVEEGDEERRVLGDDVNLNAHWKRNPDKAKNLRDRLIVSIFDDSTYDIETKTKLQSFTLNILEVETNRIKIEVMLDHPELFSKDGFSQILHVRALFSDFEPGWDDNEYIISVTIPEGKETQNQESPLEAKEQFA